MKLSKFIINSLPFVFSLNVSASGFEKIDWTLTSAEIKANSPNKLTEDTPKRLTFESELFGTDFHLEYIFDDQQKLKNVLYYYSFDKKAKNCSSEYERFKLLVEKEYGATNVESYYSDAAKNAQAESYCAYAATGELRLSSKWSSENQISNLNLATWKGTPYIGFSITPNK